jgi:hypothetical protein
MGEARTAGGSQDLCSPAPFSRCTGLGSPRPLRRIGVMARTVSVVITDDLDGLPGAETVTFGVDGVSYQIDLAELNRTRFAAALAPSIGAGRLVSRGGRRPGRGRPAPERVDRGAVRACARQAVLAVSERGRISAEVVRHYQAAH